MRHEFVLGVAASSVKFNFEIYDDNLYVNIYVSNKELEHVSPDKKS